MTPSLYYRSEMCNLLAVFKISSDVSPNLFIALQDLHYLLNDTSTLQMSLFMIITMSTIVLDLLIVPGAQIIN